MPALSLTMEEGKLAKWLVKEGDTVKSGDIIAEIETYKATMEFEAVDEGRIGALLVPEGAEGIKVNAPIATLLEEDEKPDIASAMQSIKLAVDSEAGVSAPKTAPKPLPPVPAKPAPPPPPTEAPVASTTAVRPANGERRVFASPLARRIAQQRGIELSGLKGSGPRGRIVKVDVEGAKPGQRPPVAPAARAEPGGVAPSFAIAPLPDARAFFKPEDFDEVPHDSMRKTIARRLTSAKTLI